MEKEDGRKNNRGHPGSGRKPKADEQSLIEKLSPLAPLAFKALKNALEQETPWAVKMFMDYTYGKPKETRDITIIKPEPIEITYVGSGANNINQEDFRA